MSNSLRYTLFFSTLYHAGYSIFTCDLPGHGNSDGERVFVQGMENCVETINSLTSIAYEKNADANTLPFYLCGISFGGLLACHVALSKIHKWDGVIALAPALGIEMTPILRLQQCFLSLLLKMASHSRIVPAVRPCDLSKDPKVVEEYMTDPMNVTGNLKVQTVATIMKAMEDMSASSLDFKWPLLVLHGNMDKCTSDAASEVFVKECASTDKTFEALEGVYHCVLHEPEKEMVMEKIVTWLKAHGKKE